MTQEHSALIQNHTWSLVPFDPSYNVIGCQWDFRTKVKSDGTFERRKARLVAVAHMTN